MTSPPTTHAAHEWARTISVALLPVVAVIVGGMFSFAGTEREQQTKMIELATSVLQTPPTPESGPIRDWAIRGG